jgi:hypothetical protein
VLDGNNIAHFENGSFVTRGVVGLEILTAEFCKIRKIDFGAFSGITKLTVLSMRGNEISEITPGTFAKTSSLELLALAYNKFEHLEVDVFSGLVKLKYIYLEGNELQYLHPDTFVGLPNLQTLYLSNNSGLQTPTDRHFINSHSLKQLHISGCNVRSVSVHTFANVSALEWLDLGENNLMSLDINILKSLPKLSALYLYGNPLQCDCQLQEVWRWCQEYNIQTVYEEKAPECDTPSEVRGIWFGVLERSRCFLGIIQYYADYKNYTSIEDVDMETQGENVPSFLKYYELPISTFLFVFGATGNIILIIIITCNKNMLTVPNMYILNLAVSDMIYLTVLFYDVCSKKIQEIWVNNDITCVFFIFWYRMSVGLTAYSVAVLSIQRYRVIVNPLQVHVSLQSTWRATGAIICGVWIVAALFTIPAVRSMYLCGESVMLWPSKHYQPIIIFQLIVCCVLPLCVIAFSYILTARHLVGSSTSLSEDSKIPQLNTRKNTAVVVLGLTVVFIISYVPFHISETYLHSILNLDNSVNKIMDDLSLAYNFVDTMSNLHILLSVNSCLNPVALCCTSSSFRRQFKRYLTCRCKANSPSNDWESTTRF